MYDEASQVSALIDSKATALGVIAEDLLSASVVLQQVRTSCPPQSCCSR